MRGLAPALGVLALGFAAYVHAAETAPALGGPAAPASLPDELRAPPPPSFAYPARSPLSLLPLERGRFKRRR